MTDGSTAFQPGAEEALVSPRPRSEYVGYRAFGSGVGAVLVNPEVVWDLRSVAEFAAQERRVTGGLLYGRGWVDDTGAYLVVDGYLEAGPGESSGDRLSPDGVSEFKLSEADLRLLREEAARMHPALLEVGWWRMLPALGEFGPGDFVTHADLVGPDGVGLLVYGSGPHWGTAYLGPDGHAPDSAGTLAVAESAPGPGLAAVSDAAPEPGPELVDIAAEEGLAQEPLPSAPDVPPSAAASGRPLPGRARQRMASAVREPSRVRAATAASPGFAVQEMPASVMFVIGALIIVAVIAAVIIGMLLSSAVIGVIIAVVGLIVIFGFVWISHY